MIGRIYNKSLLLLNAAIGRVHMLLEHRGIVKPVKTTAHVKNAETKTITHRDPVNIREGDKKLFAHYTNYQTCKEEVFELHDVNVNAQGIVFRGMNNLPEALPHPVFRARYGWLYMLGQYLSCKKINGDPEKKYVLIYDFWARNNYYHWLIDTLPRLVLMKEELADKNYTLLLPQDAPKFITGTLEHFSIGSITYLKPKEYLSAETLFVPYYLAGSGRIHPEKVLEVRTLLLKGVTGTIKKDRIYVSRSRQKARRVSNEEDVMNVLNEFGFETVYFEGLSFSGQMELVRNADVLVSSHGANMTNLMFMKEHAKVLELIRSDKPNFCYWALASVCSLDYYYQLCSLADHDHLRVDVNELRKNLEKMLNA